MMFALGLVFPAREMHWASLPAFQTPRYENGKRGEGESRSAETTGWRENRVTFVYESTFLAVAMRIAITEKELMMEGKRSDEVAKVH